MAPANNAGALRVLQVEDSPDDAELVCAALEGTGCRVHSERVEDEEGMHAALARETWDVIISDYNLPRFSAWRALELARASRDLPFIVTSSCIGEEEAVALVKAGATDFVMKSNLTRLPAAIERGMRECATRVAHRLAIAALHDSESRFKAIADNMPGMVMHTVIVGGRLEYRYVSEGCSAVLGIDAATFLRNNQTLYELIAPEDRAAFLELRNQASQPEVTTLNWDGRIRLPDSGEVKWVNLRASCRRQPRGEAHWVGIMTNITQSKLWQMELQSSREQLRELSAHISDAKEEERAHIARELHDELGGTLTAMKIELAQLAAGLRADHPELGLRVDSTAGLLDHAMETARSVSRSLRPGVLDYGLPAAIEWQTRDFSKRVGVPCELACDADELDLDADASTALFRIFQETLANIAKYAAASRVRITLTESEDTVLLEVEDNGIGISEGDLAKPDSFGIRNMRERIDYLGGEFEIGAGQEGGTRICVSIPVRDAKMQTV